MARLRKSTKLLNHVYGDENRAKGYKMGNTASGDGYKYRGRGIFQLTGKYSYQQFTNFYKKEYDDSKDFVKNPGLLSTDKQIAVISALWFFEEKVLDKLEIDSETDVNDVSKKVNGGKNGKEDRKELFDQAQNEIDCDEE